MWSQSIRFASLLVLSCLWASPALSSDPFPMFLHDFRGLYEKYHFGKHLPQTEIDRIAVRIWSGSGRQWDFASTTACQTICESHLELNPHSGLRYRGHIGMHLNTIVAEGIRIGMIKDNRHDRRWLLKTCQKDPSLADQLSASRLVFLVEHYGDMKTAIFQYVRGGGWKLRKKDLRDCKHYWDTVCRLKQENFKEVVREPFCPDYP